MAHKIGDLVYTFNNSFGYISEVQSMKTGNDEIPIYVVEWIFPIVKQMEIGRYEAHTIKTWKQLLKEKLKK
jgi:hypothetical protein